MTSHTTLADLEYFRSIEDQPLHAEFAECLDDESSLNPYEHSHADYQPIRQPMTRTKPLRSTWES